MRLIGILTIIFLSVSWVNAQTREDYPAHQDRLDAKNVQIFPNPAIDFVHVRIDQIPVEKIKLTVHNIIGNEVTVETEIMDEHEIRIRVKDLVGGYYLLALKDDENKFKGTYKFLKR